MNKDSETTPFLILVIHHSHTDIGYTEEQHRITRWQIDFIRQALDIVNRDTSRTFVWTCECFWAAERFLEQATLDEQRRFETAVKRGRVGLSANYLNMSELPDYPLLTHMLGRAATYGQLIRKPIRCAMTADINGFGWGYARALAENGVANLFTCIHTHHGMYPLGRRHVPFWWETPEGYKILVWSGEHYHYGNELGMMPQAVSSYLTKDECDAEMIFSDHWGVAEIRIPRFVDNLRTSGYPYQFVPVMISGLRTDNGPPNARIIDFIGRWNKTHGHEIAVEMSTLDGFFERLRKADIDIPTFRGDWPDWWTDGTSASPQATKIFRQAQRDYVYYNHLNTAYDVTVDSRIDSAAYNLTLYAEHTFSHADAMSQPWHEMTQTIAARKKAFASLAAETVGDAIDGSLRSLGAAYLKPRRPLMFRVINPLPHEVSGVVEPTVGHYEYHELRLDKPVRIRFVGEDDSLIYQRKTVPGAMAFCVPVRLGPGEIKDIEIVPNPDERKPEAEPDSNDERIMSLDTPFVHIGWEDDRGIVLWRDKTGKRELVADDAEKTVFTPLYECTPVADMKHICSVRGAMGLNRKGSDARRVTGKFIEAFSVSSGEVFASADLHYECEGLGFYIVRLTAYMHEPRVDVAVRMHKSSRWEPENVYIALPFTTGANGEQVWIDKAGARIRPRIDQLPGTLIDYYHAQAGMAVVADDFGLAVAIPDAGLLYMGEMAYGERRLFDPAKTYEFPRIYSWVMNNFWETNFDADLGGFYEFRYRVIWGEKYGDPEKALRVCRDMNHDIRCFRLEVKRA